MSHHHSLVASPYPLNPSTRIIHLLDSTGQINKIDIAQFFCDDSFDL